MKCNKGKTVEISRQLMDEFDKCLGGRKYRSVDFTPEQDAVILKYMDEETCVRKIFYKKFSEKYGLGTKYSIKKRYDMLKQKD